MVSNNVAVSVKGLSKSYTISHGEQQHSTAGEALVHRLKHPFQKAKKETFWALRDISFDINVGDVVGIIGRNGAGKSTLLKVLSQITEPTKGEINLYGRVGSLLEVGTGFHAELTGRENIFLNGAILGMRRREIQRQFDEIVDFAGVDKFLDTPVKRYSSGMYVRLAFAVAAHLDLEILMVDEVLAVGDTEFQKKCLGKMQDVARSGRTVLFVSHQMQAVSTLCNKAMMLSQGQFQYIGDVPHAIDLYMSAPLRDGSDGRELRRSGSGEVRVTSFEMSRDVYNSTDDIEMEIEVTAQREGLSSFYLSLHIMNGMGLTVLHLDSRLLNAEFQVEEKQRIKLRIPESRLAHGDYVISTYLFHLGGVFDFFERAAQFTIAPLLPYPTSFNDCANEALYYPRFEIPSHVSGAVEVPS